MTYQLSTRRPQSENSALLKIPIYDPIEDNKSSNEEIEFDGKAKVRKWLHHTQDKDTSKLSSTEALSLIQQNIRMKKSEIFTADMKTSWIPGSDELKFGKKSQIPVQGWFVSGDVAKIVWGVDTHILVRCKGMTTIKVNGHNIKNQIEIHGGEKIQIGKTKFVYVVTG